MANLQLAQLLTQYITQRGAVDMSAMKTAMDAVAPEHQYNIMSSTIDDSRWTAVHRAAVKNDTEVAKNILAMLTKKEKIKLIKRQDMEGNTAVHWASLYGHTETLDCLLKHLNNRETYQVVKVQGGDGNTAVHDAASRGRTGTVKYLLDSVPQDKQEQLLGVRDVDQKTALDLALDMGHNETGECLHEYANQHEAVNNSAAQIELPEEDQPKLGASLSSEEIEAALHLHAAHLKVLRDKQKEGEDVRAVHAIMINDVKSRTDDLEDKVSKMDDVICPSTSTVPPSDGATIAAQEQLSVEETDCSG